MVHKLKDGRRPNDDDFRRRQGVYVETKTERNHGAGSMLGVDLKLPQGEKRLLQKQRKVLNKQLEAGSLFTETVELTDDKTTEESEGREMPYVELEMNVESEVPYAPKRNKCGFILGSNKRK